MEKSEIKTVLESLKLDVKFQFVPFSQSRNAKEKNLSLNYKATILYNGKELFTTDYFMGIAHAPSYKQGKLCVDDSNAIKFEAENGQTFKHGNVISQYIKKPIIPDTVDFFYCIQSDCDVLNYSDFEDFADSFGYDKDSKRAEKIYQTCIKQALKLRNAIGETGLNKLAESYQDY